MVKNDAVVNISGEYISDSKFRENLDQALVFLGIVTSL